MTTDRADGGRGGPRRLRVYVSAYPDELAAERSAAVRAVEQLRLTPVVGTVAGTGTGHDLLRALVLGCDMFVGVYAERYGERDASSGLSDLEAEYLAATDLPRLVYLREDAPAREPHLAVLVARIQADDTTSYRPFAGKVVVWPFSGFTHGQALVPKKDGLAFR